MTFVQAMAAVDGGARVSYAEAANVLAPEGYIAVWYKGSSGELLLDAYGATDPSVTIELTQQGVSNWIPSVEEILKTDWTVI